MTMQCPSCQSKHFDVFDFHGEEVDRCQDCCGLWFERGELNSALSTADNGDDRVRLERSLDSIWVRLHVNAAIASSRCNIFT